MVPKDALSEREAAFENQFFSKKEAELLAKLKGKSEAQNAVAKLAQATGVSDEKLLSSLREFGYDADSIGLLHLVPILSVAWVDGKIDTAEREAILKLAELRGVTPGTGLYEKLVKRLQERPSDQEFSAALEVVRQMIALLPADKADAAKKDIVGYSTSIAELSRKMLGFGPSIDAQERALLESIQKGLSAPQLAAAQGLVRK